MYVQATVGLSSGNSGRRSNSRSRASMQLSFFVMLPAAPMASARTHIFVPEIVRVLLHSWGSMLAMSSPLMLLD